MAEEDGLPKKGQQFIGTTIEVSYSNSTDLTKPSLEDWTSLRHVVDDIPRRLWVVAIIAFWERFTFWGLTAPWQNYMQNARHGKSGAPGALDLGQAMATRIYCAFYIFYYVSPICFAIISDTRLGRFKTLCISVMLYVVGCAVLVTTSIDPLLDRNVGLPGLIVAMFLVGLGGGGFKALMVPFIDDQYHDTGPKLKTLKSGERVVTDRSLTMQYIYNMYYWVGNVGSLSHIATAFLEKHYSFAIAYGLCLGSMVIGMAMLYLGTNLYVKLPAEGNVLPEATKVLLCASKNGFKMAHASPKYQYEHHEKTVSWTTEFTNELCRGLRACRVLIAFVFFYVCFDQMQNNLISQAKQMETHGLPNDLMPAINQVSCIVFGPIIQYGLYPLLNHRKISFKPIARIAVGFTFIALAMLYATITQHLIYSTGPCFKSPGNCAALSGQDGFHAPNHISVWIQTPVYVLMSIGEIFALVTGLEYAQDNAPRDMKGIVQAINLIIAGIGSALAMAVTPVAKDPQVLILYASLCGVMALATVVFWLVFRKYDRHDDENRHGKDSGDEDGAKKYDSLTDQQGQDVGSNNTKDIETGLNSPTSTLVPSSPVVDSYQDSTTPSRARSIDTANEADGLETPTLVSNHEGSCASGSHFRHATNCVCGHSSSPSALQEATPMR